MLLLIGAMLCSALVIHCFRAGQVLGIPVRFLLIVNYLIASGVGWGSASMVPSGVSGAVAWGLGGFAVAVGLMFLGSFTLLNWAVDRLGPSTAGAASRLSAVIPVLLSIVLFAERPGVWGWVGIALALVALPSAGGGGAGRPAHWGPAAAIFFAFGFTDFLLKVQSELFPAASKPLFLAVVYTTALVAALVFRQRGEGRWSGRAVALGAALGLANYLGTLLFSLSLNEVAGSVAYPINAVGTIALVSVSSLVVWKERFTPRLGFFLVVAMAAVGLLALR